MSPIPAAWFPAPGWLCPDTARAPGYRGVPAHHPEQHFPRVRPWQPLFALGNPLLPKSGEGLLVPAKPRPRQRFSFGSLLYIQAALKKYQTEQRSKGDSLDKCQAELKKLRKKSQGSKNPQKYSDKELQVGHGGDPGISLSHQ